MSVFDPRHTSPTQGHTSVVSVAEAKNGSRAFYTVGGDKVVGQSFVEISLYDANGLYLGNSGWIAVQASDNTYSVSFTLPTAYPSGTQFVVSTAHSSTGGTPDYTSAAYTHLYAPRITSFGPDTGANAHDAYTSGDANHGLTFSGTGTPGGIIQLYDGLTNSTSKPTIPPTRIDTSTILVGADGTWSYTTGPIDPLAPSGIFQFSAREAMGGTTSPFGNIIAVTMDITAPTPTVALAAPTGTGADTSNPALSGGGDANAAVSVHVTGLDANANPVDQTFTTTADGAGAWSLSAASLGLADGSYTATATETDLAGNVGTSSPLAFTLDTAAPAVAVGLSNDSGTAGDGITNDASLSGTGDANASVTVVVTDGNGNIVYSGTVPTDATGAWSLSGATLGLADGSYTATVSETDAAGNTASSSLSLTLSTAAPAVTVDLANDTGAPGVSNDPSLAGGGDANASVTVVVTDGNGNVVYSGTVPTDANGAWSLDKAALGLPDGSYTATVSETDVAGNTASASTSFTLDTVAPTVTVALANDTGAPGVTNDQSLIGSGDANANVVLTVTDASGNIDYLGSLPTDATGTWSLAQAEYGLSDGTYTATVSETDAAGNSAQASTTFILDTIAPSVTMAPQVLSNSANAGNANDALSGTYADNLSGVSAITVYDSFNPGWSDAATFSNGTWSYAANGLSAGEHDFSVVATDAADNASTSTDAGTFYTTTAFNVALVGHYASYWQANTTAPEWTAASLGGTPGVLLGDKTGAPLGASPTDTLFIPNTAGQQLITKWANSTDVRQTEAAQAIAAQLNVEYGLNPAGGLSAAVGGDLISEAVKWMEGVPNFLGALPASYTDGSSGKIDTGSGVSANNGDGVLQVGASSTGAEYNTTTAAFTSTTVRNTAAAWSTEVAKLALPSGDFVNVSGLDLHSALNAYNVGHLLTSVDGTAIGWSSNGSLAGLVDINPNTEAGMWQTLSAHGIGTISAT